MDNLFEFASSLARAHAATLLPDSPTRIGAPEDSGRARPDFDALPLAERRDAADRLCRREQYKQALVEAFGEHELSESFFALIRDGSAPPAVVGQLAIEMALDYLKRCAERHDEDIRDFA